MAIGPFAWARAARSAGVPFGPSRSAFEQARINRAPSPVLATALPWLTVVLGSLSPTWPVIASAPVLPPLGFLALIAWQQLRPGLFPVWAGLPLGLVDDLYSGQPLGSAVLLWSLAIIGLDLAETRYPWRGFGQDWLVASALTAVYLLAMAALAAGGAGMPSPIILLPQLGLSVVIYPLGARLISAFDRWRLVRFKVL